MHLLQWEVAENGVGLPSRSNATQDWTLIVYHISSEKNEVICRSVVAAGADG